MKRALCLVLSALLLVGAGAWPAASEEKTDDVSDTLYKIFKKRIQKKPRTKKAPTQPQAPATGTPQTAPPGASPQVAKPQVPKILTTPPDQVLDPTKVNVIRTGTLPAHPRSYPVQFATCPLGNKYVIAWEESTNNGQTASGVVALYNHSFRRVTLPMIYTANRDAVSTGRKNFMKGNLALPFAGGNSLLAYIQKAANWSGQKGYFTVMGSDGKPKKYPTPFGEHSVTEISATLLPGKKAALIAYHDFDGVGGKGRFIVVSHTGNILVGPKIFNNRGMTSHICALTLSNGLVAIVFECGRPYTVLIDTFGHVVREAKKFYHKSLGELAACRLTGRKLLVVCTGLGGKSYVIDGKGDVAAQQALNLGGATLPELLRLSDGNFSLTYGKRTPAQASLYDVAAAVLDSSGSIVKGPRVMEAEGFWLRRGEGCFSRSLLTGDRVLIVYQLYNGKYGLNWESAAPAYMMLK